MGITRERVSFAINVAMTNWINIVALIIALQLFFIGSFFFTPQTNWSLVGFGQTFVWGLYVNLMSTLYYLSYFLTMLFVDSLIFSLGTSNVVLRLLCSWLIVVAILTSIAIAKNTPEPIFVVTVSFILLCSQLALRMRKVNAMLTPSVG